jgi:amino acid transporter
MARGAADSGMDIEHAASARLGSFGVLVLLGLPVSIAGVIVGLVALCRGEDSSAASAFGLTVSALATFLAGAALAEVCRGLPR